ncbi:SGNH/GDSL hydrolase family protein [Affinirhizobium pseudoryzae]|uniref:SGNH/GDSL hydrolase family protein n=1 Tax=Allorhizobium pseudoryzae TaxID=379684 RepID=UPI0013EA9E58|nr:DUF459 domain-containing protein [Allorhizobium pseudoryzae]
MAAARLGMRSVAVVLCALLVIFGDAASAFAQERRTLFDMMFGERRPQRADRSIIQIEPQRTRSRQPTAATPRAPRPAGTAAPAAETTTVEKLENARKVLVVGDFTAVSIGTGLEMAFAEDPSVLVVKEGSGSSGLVRQDYFNWPDKLPGLLDEVKPAVVVLMIGANDRQTMAVGEGSEKFRTEAWFEEYERRVAELAEIVTERKLPLLWVGLPAFQSSSLTADAVTLNGIYRPTIEKAGGEFIDIWDGFVNEDGQFIITGSDINGQQVRLRSPDGIGFTDAGKRKLAFYVEKVVKRHLGGLDPGALIRLDAGNLPLITSLPPEAAASVPSQPISLSDPQLDGGDSLLGGSLPPTTASDSPRNLLLTRGQLPDPPAGRIDNYRLTPATTASQP